ncbi:CCA tRNA nucleotidyltransferase [Alkalihalobacillus sp. MEB130]|uniref:CCA tRNA nucleotidyltransferase n=1 Tax=Alkalihalobacillus sp. MEB130 TaxID=2976704 RepID=UPI0028DDF37D|nr:CCA tRNA nucleotidyltransferase [Alkalihalobacillus sp. MEB130]MDT8859984.1 CCA tRNA nucleotidyltransferase [Alkalihalobacillus sp. MEB130]
MSDVWMKAKEVIHLLQKSGYDSFIVGGAVRDVLLERNIADVDLVTSATPDQVTDLFPKTFRMNTEHDTIIVRHESEHFELTTMKNLSLLEDVKRRDLTINSLLMDHEGHIVDLVGGQDDLERAILRSTDPFNRMTEDPLRMVRVARFVSELGFTVDQQLLTILETEHDRIRHVAQERIIKEWLKVIKGPYRNQALEILIQTNLYKSLPNLALTKQILERLIGLKPLTNHSETVCLTAFALCIDHEADAFLKNLTLSKAQIKEVKDRLTYFDYRKNNQWDELNLYYASLPVARDVEILRLVLGEKYEPISEVNELWDSLPIHRKSELSITGRDLVHYFNREQGPWLKETITLAEQLVLTRTCTNEKGELLETLRTRREEL